MTFNFWTYFTPFLVFLLLPWNRYLLVCHSLEGGGKRTSRILWKGKGGWRFFFQVRRLDGKKVINFWRGFGVFRDDHCKFHFTALIWLTIFEETERHCITCYFSLMFLAYFISLISFKVFLMLYFLSIASLRGRNVRELNTSEY